MAVRSLQMFEEQARPGVPEEADQTHDALNDAGNNLQGTKDSEAKEQEQQELQLMELGGVRAQPIGAPDAQPQLLRADTSMRMQLTKQTATQRLTYQLCSAGCCFWLPLVCFLAAANTLETCQELDSLTGVQSIGDFIKQYSLFMILSPVFVQIMCILAAKSGSKFCFKEAEYLHFITAGFQIGLMIRGWMHYHNTTDEACYNGVDPEPEHAINPRTLLYAILLVQTILISIILCCVPCVLMGWVKVKVNGEEA